MTDIDSLVSLTKASRILDVTRTTLFKWLKAKKIEAVKVGCTWKIKKSVLENIIECGLDLGE